MGESIWYFRTLGGDEVGPITADELRSHAARGAIGWRPVSSVRGLIDGPDPPPLAQRP